MHRGVDEGAGVLTVSLSQVLEGFLLLINIPPETNDGFCSAGKLCACVCEIYLCVHACVVYIWYTPVWVHVHMCVYMHAEVKDQHQVSSLTAAHIYYYYFEKDSLAKFRAQ